MKANELRPENVINYQFYKTLKQGFVTTVSPPVVVIDHSFKMKEENLIGVPLTEEWLLKFGFELRDGKYYKGKYLIEDGISQYFNNGYSFRITIDNQNSTHASSVKYVHQLQNLYFALTGQELELK